jgi:hypothetical protein
VSDDPLDVFRGSLSSGFVDWAAVHLPEGETGTTPDSGDDTDPVDGTDTDPGTEGEAGAAHGSEDDVLIDLVEVGPNPVAENGPEDGAGSEDGVEDQHTLEVEVENGSGNGPVHDDDALADVAGPGVDDVAGPDVDPDDVDRSTADRPTADRPTADRPTVDRPGGEHLGDDDPVPLFPGVDQDELADFEPYRPDAGRPLRSSRKDRP